MALNELFGGNMIFTRLGMILAWLALLTGASRIFQGYHVISLSDASDRAYFAKHWFVSSPFRAIEQGLIIVTIAIALGILVEISRTLRR